MSSKDKLSKVSEKSTSTKENCKEVLTSMSQEQEEIFQVELYWCIKQLQTALNSGKLDNKRIVDHKKALNSLMSSSTSMVKKRQVMRLSLGDYREKMLKDEKKNLKNSVQIKIKTGKPSESTVFLKKSNHSMPSLNQNLDVNLQAMQLEDSSHHQPSDNSFKFSFEVDVL